MLEDIRLTVFRAVAAKLPPLRGAVLRLQPDVRLEFTNDEVATAFQRGRDAGARRTLAR